MKEERLYIDNITAVVYGGEADRAYLFVHGQYGRKEEGAAFAEIRYRDRHLSDAAASHIARHACEVLRAG